MVGMLLISQTLLEHCSVNEARIHEKRGINIDLDTGKVNMDDSFCAFQIQISEIFHSQSFITVVTMCVVQIHSYDRWAYAMMNKITYS